MAHIPPTLQPCNLSKYPSLERCYFNGAVFVAGEEVSLKYCKAAVLVVYMTVSLNKGPQHRPQQFYNP